MTEADFLLKKYSVSLPEAYLKHLTYGLQYISKVLGRNKELINRWLELFKEAVDAGSTIPQDRAWILFHEEYRALSDEKGWVRR